MLHLPGMTDRDRLRVLTDAQWEVLAPLIEACRLYRPRLVGHRIATYAARAAVESWSRLTALGGLNPCRSMSQVAL